MAAQPARAERLRTRPFATASTGLVPASLYRPVRATTDHLVPKVKGGPSWLENEVVSCGRCNRERGHLSPADWLAEWSGAAGSPTRRPSPGP